MEIQRQGKSSILDQLESIDAGSTKPKKMTKQYKQQNQKQINQSSQSKAQQDLRDIQLIMNDRPKREIKKTSPFDNSDTLLNSSPVTQAVTPHSELLNGARNGKSG